MGDNIEKLIDPSRYETSALRSLLADLFGGAIVLGMIYAGFALNLGLWPF